ncbi:MAG TPA: S8 family serine peptidase [Gaiellaceae bacterium]
MRRPLLLAAILGLVVAASASAALTPVRRPVGENGVLPRVRAGNLTIPAGHAHPTTRVIVRLAAPPLAAWNARRTLASASRVQHLNVHAAASVAYVASLRRAQNAVAAAVRAAIPAAQVQEHYSILLDGFAVQVPTRSLAKLVRVKGVTKVYPSMAYFATMDRGPSVIHATDLEAATGDKGQGIKIGVVDTGVDPTSPFLNPTGFTYPPGFPKGDTKLTTPKVIVARVFPGFPRDKKSTVPFDNTEPHGTHVSGIAAGDEGTNAPKGPDHPAVANLSGVAPKAWIGNYRVFTVPTPFGHEANTPEIVHAFEAAVADGMNVINFSGGGPQTDPANDAMFETVHNVSLAGVVPVIAAGNDREDFGFGTAGSPAAAPDGIAVAATSNSHVFAPALSVVGGPPSLGAIPIQSAGGAKFPGAWSTLDQTIVDVTSVMGTDGKPVEAHLCGSATEPNTSVGTLPKNSVKGKILLVSRGICTFVSKAERAALGGAAGIILVDNRFGEANPIPVRLPIPAGMISDLDGQQLRGYLAANGSQATIRVSASTEEIQTGRSGVITSFSSAGPTDFGWFLKPDISAPGLDVLSSTPPATTGSTFSVFAGTSMATPHVAGAAALLLQRHPNWTAPEVKSALMSTAGPAWQNTARTEEASVLLEGSGLANVAAADDPKIFTDPQSLSFQRLDVSTGTQRKALLVTVSDAGDGAGAWTASVSPQAQTAGVTIDVPGSVTLAPGGFASVPVDVTADATAATGENYGFIDLSGNGVQRRIPYAFLVERPALRNKPSVPLKRQQVGSTASGTNDVSVYCCPGEPFGPPPNYTGPTMNEDGAEHLYSYEVNQPIVNFGVSILGQSQGALIDPFVLGSKDENDVQGYAGIPTDVNSFTFDANLDVGAAGVQFPRLQRFYVSVDSRADPFTNKSQKGKYLLNAWVDDLTPPFVRVVTTRITAGRPLIIAEVADFQSGVDPLSLVINYNHALVGASAYDPVSGLAVFGIPAAAPKFKAGRTNMVLMASDYQEAKNINTVGDQLMPNTAFKSVRLHVVNGPTVTWIEPPARECAFKKDQLLVVANSTTKVERVVFTDNGRRIGVDKTGPSGIYSIAWSTAKLKKGTHHLLATIVDAAGRKAAAGRDVRVCK